MTEQIKPFFHKTPKELDVLLKKSPELAKIWKTLTPISKNEWICYVVHPKKKETKENHLERFEQDLLKGKRRPCCWPGCPHCNPNSAKWFKSVKEK